MTSTHEHSIDHVLWKWKDISSDETLFVLPIVNDYYTDATDFQDFTQVKKIRN